MVEKNDLPAFRKEINGSREFSDIFIQNVINVENADFFIYLVKKNLIDTTRKIHKANYTPFLLACCLGKVDCVKFLLEHTEGKCFSEKSGNGSNGFMAASMRDQVEVVKFLMGYDKDACLNLKNNRNQTGFIMACDSGAAEAVDFIFKETHGECELIQGQKRLQWF